MNGAMPRAPIVKLACTKPPSQQSERLCLCLWHGCWHASPCSNAAHSGTSAYRRLRTRSDCACGALQQRRRLVCRAQHARAHMPDFLFTACVGVPWKLRSLARPGPAATTQAEPSSCGGRSAAGSSGSGYGTSKRTRPVRLRSACGKYGPTSILDGTAASYTRAATWYVTFLRGAAAGSGQRGCESDLQSRHTCG